MRNAVFAALFALGIGAAVQSGLAGEWKIIEGEEADTALKKSLAAAGLRPETCYLRGGQFVFAGGERGNFQPLDKKAFPYDWDFAKGGLRGICNIGTGVKDLKNDDGVLTFKTVSDKNAYFSWGNFSLLDPGISVCYGDIFKYIHAGVKVLRVRIKQSAPESVWQVVFKQVGGKGGQAIGAPITIKGMDWQTVDLPAPSYTPPLTGVRLLTQTPGNQVRIEWVKPYYQGANPHYRKTLVLDAPVRWAKVSVQDYEAFKLYVNGTLALQSPPTPMGESALNGELPAKLFRVGENVLALETLGMFQGPLIDGALLLTNGEYARFDSDKTWKVRYGENVADWTAADFGWQTPLVRTPKDKFEVLARYGGWFNPSYKDVVDVQPTDGRAQPIFGAKETVALKIAVPRLKNGAVNGKYELMDEMGDGFTPADAKIASGELKFKNGGADAIAELSYPAGTLKPNVAYALVLACRRDGDAENHVYRYEFVVCGPVKQPIVKNPKNYTDGMKLKLIWEIDAATPQDPKNFFCFNGVGKPIESAVIKTALGAFRTLDPKENAGGDTGDGMSFMSWVFPVLTPGRPYVAIAEYPDDSARCQELRIVDAMPINLSKYREQPVQDLANDTVALGFENPLTGTIKESRALFWPSNAYCSLNILSIGGVPGHEAESAPKVGKIRVYEVLDDVPARDIKDAPGPRKWIGQQSEPGWRSVAQSCYAGPAASRIWLHYTLCERPYFYRDWLITFINYVKRLRFSGENAAYTGVYMYEGVNFPSQYAYMTNMHHTKNSFRDCGTLMAKMFEENDLGFFAALEVWGLAAVTAQCHDDNVAAGADTLGQVDRYGKQHLVMDYQYASRSKALVPNWIRPEVKRHYFNLIDEILGLWGKQKGFKGVVSQVNQVLGPSWLCSGVDPYLGDYSDWTIAEFEKDTGVKVPVSKTAPNRFSQRYRRLTGDPKTKKIWTDWRAREMSDLYFETADRIKRYRPDLKFILNNSNCRPNDDAASDSGPVFDYARNCGLDIPRMLADERVIFAESRWTNIALLSNIGGKESDFRSQAHSLRQTQPFSDHKNALATRVSWTEAQFSVPNPLTSPFRWFFRVTSPESWPVGAGDNVSDYFTNLFIRTNPGMVLMPLQDAVLWNGRELEMGRFSKSFRVLPAADYKRLTGAGRDKNVWIETALFDGKVYGYVANPQGWPLTATLRFSDGKPYDLVEDRAVDRTWEVATRPYEIRCFRVDGVTAPETAVESAEVKVSDAGRAYVEGMFNLYENTVKRSRDVLREKGVLDATEAALGKARDAIRDGDYSTAAEIMTLDPIFTRLKLYNWSEPGYTPKQASAGDVPTNFALDGDVGEWRFPADGAVDTVRQIHALETASLAWTGKDDFSARWAAAWDKNNLYFACRVYDDKMFYCPGAPTDGDYLELFLDAELAADYGESAFTEDDFQIKLVPVKETSDMLVFCSRGDKHGAKNPVNLPLKAKWRKLADGYSVEMTVPWTNVRRQAVASGYGVGFDVMFLDRDAAENECKHLALWSAPRNACWKDPRIFGQLTFKSSR